ncbi:MAG: hypothetical protein P8J59_02795 [Phycisphaerales bacterium]|nr:hypothetical protein [Phycisphaerales bacterium]
MTDLGDIEIMAGGEADRPLLSRLSPRWFKNHLPTASWCAVQRGELIAAAMLEVLPDGTASMEIHGCDESAIAACGGPLIDQVLDTARTCGALVVDADVDSTASLMHAELLRSRDFEIHETFDSFEAPRAMLQEALGKILNRMGDRIKSRFETEIVEIDQKHLDSVAAAWSAWIGGSINRGVFDMRRRFHARDSTDPERSLQLVATHENSVVGFCCTRIIEPGVLKIDGEGIHPRFRMDTLHARLASAMYERAEAADIHTIRFDAGSRQPNTRTMVRRNRIASLNQRLHLRRSFDAGAGHPAT